MNMGFEYKAQPSLASSTTRRENIAQEIDYAIDHRTDFHQFMLYTPVPGTPLYQQMSEQGRMLEDVNLADIHGQHKFNFRHAAISRDDSKRFLDWAFRRDFERNGPSLYRMCQTMLQGWRRYKDYPDMRVRERFARESAKLQTAYSAALWAMEKQFRDVNRSVSEEIRALRHEVEREFGTVAWVAARVAGPVLLWTTRREERRLAAGRTYEPPMFLERTHWPRTQTLAACATRDTSLPVHRQSEAKGGPSVNAEVTKRGCWQTMSRRLTSNTNAKSRRVRRVAVPIPTGQDRAL